MSRENGVLVRRGIEAWNRGDFDAFSELAHPDSVWVPAVAQLVEGEEAVYRGLSGLRRFWEDWHGGVFDFRFREEDIRDLGDTVLVLSRVSATGRASGVDLDTPFGMVLTIQGGRLIRMVSYPDREEALEAVGLSE